MHYYPWLLFRKDSFGLWVECKSRKSLGRSSALFRQLRQDDAGGSGHSPVGVANCAPWIEPDSRAAELPGDLAVENERTESETASGLQVEASEGEGLSGPQMGKVGRGSGLAGQGNSC